jgi:sortase A
MRKYPNLKDGAVILGVILLIWSITSAFAGPGVWQPPLSPIDQPDISYSRVIFPTIVTPTAIPSLDNPLAAAHLPTIAPFTPGPVSSTAAPATAQPQVAPTATATPVPSPRIPERIVIPSIHLNAPVIPAAYSLVGVDGLMFQQWEAPDGFAAGWQSSSAPLGVPGNTVLNGHHNIYGEVFGHLIDLSPGDTIEIYSGNILYSYEITNKMILPERDEPLAVRLDNARWLESTTDERLTLITCWPHWTNTHRLIIVAKPIGREMVSSAPQANP